MKRLIWFTIINITAMLFLIASRIDSVNDTVDLILIGIAILLIIANLIRFFVERKKLNKFK